VNRIGTRKLNLISTLSSLLAFVSAILVTLIGQIEEKESVRSEGDRASLRLYGSDQMEEKINGEKNRIKRVYRETRKEQRFERQMQQNRGQTGVDNQDLKSNMYF